jgi:general secretion pathway protein C
LLAQQCAVLTWRLYELAQPASLTPGNPRSLGAGEWWRSPDLGNLSRLSLWQGAATPGGQGGRDGGGGCPENPAQRPAQRGAGKLDPAKSIAIIAHNGTQNSYGIGDYIDGTQARIRQVFADRVIIARDGRDETLMLDGEEYGKPLPKPARQEGLSAANCWATRARSPITSIFLRSGWTVA